MQSSEIIQQTILLQTPSVLTPINSLSFQNHGLKVTLKRDDQIHHVVCGNKWRKLKYQLIALLQQPNPAVISFGGAWSNHLHALGYCCHRLAIPLTVFIRGEESHYQSAMIKDLRTWAVTIKWLDRGAYRNKDTILFLHELKQSYPGSTIIPEGGSGSFALEGVREMVKELPDSTDYFCLAVGSGGTFAGAALEINKKNMQLIGIPVVNALADIKHRIEILWQAANEHTTNKNELLQFSGSKFHLIDGYHGGGYAKISAKTARYIKQFHLKHSIILEPIYVAKLLMAIENLAEQGYFKKHSEIVVLHSGGLQGLRGIKQFSLNHWYQEVSAGSETSKFRKTARCATFFS